MPARAADTANAKTLAMRAIFISYRRNDSEGEAGRLFDDLARHFGKDTVFMDVTAIQPGRDFRKAIDESVATCGVLLAIISNNWIDAKNDAGLRRLDDPADFVRLETASALRRDIPVIPVLVRGVKMPPSEQLPDDLKDLAYRNGVELTHARWASDVQLLIKALEAILGTPRLAGTNQTPASADHAADGASFVERPPEKNADEQPSSVLLMVRWRKKKLLALGSGLVVALALVGYGAYYVKVELETDQRAAAGRAALDKAEADRRRDGVEAARAADRAIADSSVRPLTYFSGIWKNADTATRGLTTLQITVTAANVAVHVWGRCHPTDCDWGEVTATPLSSDVSTSVTQRTRAITAVFKKNFAETTLMIRPLTDGSIQAEVATRFTDNSGRAAYTDSYEFRRAP